MWLHIITLAVTEKCEILPVWVNLTNTWRQLQKFVAARMTLNGRKGTILGAPDQHSRDPRLTIAPRVACRPLWKAFHIGRERSDGSILLTTSVLEGLSPELKL